MQREAGTMIIYEHSESVCCQKVRMAVEEKGLPYEQRYVKLESGEAKHPDFLAINPKGVVPVLIDGNHTIFESTIINEYLDDAYPTPPLMPSDPFLRSRRRYWARQIDDELHVPHIATISFIIAFNKAFRAQLDTQEKLDAYVAKIPMASHRATMSANFSSVGEDDRLQASLVAYDLFLDELELELEHYDWLAGDQFSLADIDVVPYIWRLHNLGLDFMWDDRPRVAAWLSRVTQRPSFKAAVIDTALPEWLELMRSAGEEARPVAMALLRTVREQSRPRGHACE
jgi:glutathione S-transferase